MKKLLYVGFVSSCLMACSEATPDERASQSDRPANPIANTENGLIGQMEASLNKSAWDQIPFVQWTFMGARNFVWDKHNDVVWVQWGNGEFEAAISPKAKTGQVYQNGERVTDNEDQLLEAALSMFFNDSFWLCAPFKLNDPGAITEVLEDNIISVKYTAGGSTPGDQYDWYLDKSHHPERVEMMLAANPSDTLKFTWEGWDTTYNGALIALNHMMAGDRNIALTNVAYSNDLSSLSMSSNAMKELKMLE